MGGAGEEKIEGPSAGPFCPRYEGCKRASGNVDVGLCHQKERETCPIRSGTRWGWPVARGSVCQKQVVSNHRSGVAARNHPFWQGSREGTARASRPFRWILVRGGWVAQSAYTGRFRPTWIGPRAAPSCCREMRPLPMSLHYCTV